MRPGVRARPTGSLFVQLITLIGVTQIAANLIAFVILFNLPPPAPDFYRLSEIEQTFHGAPPALGERRPLEVRVADALPGPLAEGRAARLSLRLAHDLGVAPEKVAIIVQRGPLQRPRFRVMRDRRVREALREEPFLVAPFEVGLQRDDGRWTMVRPKPPFGLNPWQQRVALIFLLTMLFMAPFAFRFARRLSAPITLFADAAERLGRDPRAPPLDPRGPAEIRAAMGAFNQMQERLRRYVEDRTTMVAAIAHDLRTPLTRLRFRIEGLPEAQRRKIAADIDQMDEMVGAALAFVRDTARSGDRTPLELSSLLESLCDELAETGADAQALPGDKVVIEGDPAALRRLFANLLDNALKFGGQARARVFREDASAVVEVEDDGPGLKPEDAERVFEPFFRAEPSRSRKTGGTGLGLAIVRSIVRAHGGEITLSNRPGGGLVARVVLPL